MAGEDYYWELRLENGAFKAIGPDRTIEFFLEAVEKGREHILSLYDPNKAENLALIRKSLKVVREFSLQDSELEMELARMLVRNIRCPPKDKNRLVTEYMVDLMNRFVLNPEDSLAERYHEYASFRASADYITITYGIRSEPKLLLTRIEAECMKKGFTEGNATMTVDSLLRSGRRFYEHAAGTAEQILSRDFFRLDKREKKIWTRRAILDGKIADNYGKCLEILRVANYKSFN